MLKGSATSAHDAVAIFTSDMGLSRPSVLFASTLRTTAWNLQNTVKLGIKELLNREQIGFKELFTDYQLFYTINLLLNKELLPI